MRDLHQTQRVKTEISILCGYIHSHSTYMYLLLKYILLCCQIKLIWGQESCHDSPIQIFCLAFETEKNRGNRKLQFAWSIETHYVIINI